jgi:hypothetical protein
MLTLTYNLMDSVVVKNVDPQYNLVGSVVVKNADAHI